MILAKVCKPEVHLSTAAGEGVDWPLASSSWISDWTVISVFTVRLGYSPRKIKICVVVSFVEVKGV